ncbi:TonB-dependent receptor [Empedobacter tilapiae]|uniref:TonB-dependent receptor n=1 Tax=Empedobacter tilapiae TaxID=2491114 RepID=A0A4Z1AUJ1_9FLAO|nr:carboxypeptidase-like regulatory domain-containing protein [Empedobacter tilapiae]TGN22983.1 TonB-dependent receptor [Empedobacter tilapiae]
MKKIFTSVFILSAALSYAQSTLKGKITDQNQQPIIGAEVFWQSSDISVITDDKGNFEIENYQPTSILGVFYDNETTTFKELKDEFQNITINVKDHFGDTSLNEVVVRDTSSSLKKSKFATNMTTMTGKELLKAACCNLAESFETNPSIDVNFSDAVTGNKQIKMLGLTSPYILIAEENIPNVRGASQAFGLSFTPGTWVESIQVTKGAGTVINGYESISGQINTELIKPSNDIPLFVNLYGSTDSRFEGNVHLNKKLNDKWSTSLFMHGNARVSKNDMNDDGFLDNPLGHQVNVMNRWQYQNLEKGWVGFLSARYLNDTKQAGQVDFDKDRDKLTTNYWGSEINTNRVDISSKIGYVFPEMPYQSMGLQTAFSYHKQDSYFGLNQYDIEQQSFYSNYIFSSIISNTKNKFSTGASFTYDKFKEFVALPTDANYDRIDNSAGAFFEYTFDNMKNFNMIAGLRGDYHNRMGFFLTPRLHTRYTPVKGTTIKASVGRGKRINNIFAENQNLFASSRQFNILGDGNGKTYGLDPEIAWNYGFSVTQEFKLFGKNADVTADFYRTDFQNQIVTDIDYSARQVRFYNLEGDSYANSFQFDFNYNPFTHFKIRASYKYYDIATDYENGKLERPLQAKHRFFTNLEYETHERNGRNWRFDVTYNWIGKQRLPNTSDNLPENQLNEYSNPFGTINFQITRVFSKRFEVYVGGENVTNYQQHRVILGADNPFGSNFDSSIVYAPIFGQMYYAGLRFNLK